MEFCWTKRRLAAVRADEQVARRLRAIGEMGRDSIGIQLDLRRPLRQTAAPNGKRLYGAHYRIEAIQDDAAA